MFIRTREGITPTSRYASAQVTFVSPFNKFYLQYRQTDVLHACNIKEGFIGCQQFSAAKILLKDVTDPATRAWIISLYRAAHPALTDAQIEALEWPDVVKAVETEILEGLTKDTAPEDVHLLLFGGNHSTWAMQMMYEEGTLSDPTLLQRSVLAEVGKFPTYC